jgi:hypothetical protein
MSKYLETLKKVDDELKLLNVRMLVRSNNALPMKLDNIEVKGTEPFEGYQSVSAESTIGATMISYNQGRFHLYHDAENLLERIFSKHIREALKEKEAVDNYRVYQYSGAYYFVNHDLDERILHRYNDHNEDNETNKNIQSLSNILQSGRFHTLDVYELFRERFINLFDNIIIHNVYKTQNDIDYKVCATDDLNKVFFTPLLYINITDTTHFNRCIDSQYLLLRLFNNSHNKFNSEVGVGHYNDSYTYISTIISDNLPKCSDCGVRDYSKYQQPSLTFTTKNNNIVLCNQCDRFYQGSGIDFEKFVLNKHKVGGHRDSIPLVFERFNSEATPLYMGVELETDTEYTQSGDEDDDSSSDVHYDGDEHDRNANLVLQTISSDDLVFAKADGSLSSGFEMVSQPITLAKHLTKVNWKQGFDILEKLGYKSHNTSSCGMHVHVNRDFFGKSKVIQNVNASKIAYLFTNLSTDLIRFTRRKEYNLNRWAGIQNIHYVLNGVKTKKSLQSAFRRLYPARNKYVALNTMHANTYEFRIFRGTLNYNTFVATLQLVDNMCRMVKDIPNDDTMFTHLDTITFNDIVNYRPYNELTTYWTSRKGNN